MPPTRKLNRNDLDYYEEGKIQGVVLSRISALERKIDDMQKQFVKSHEEMHKELHQVDSKIVSLNGRVFGIAGGISTVIAVLAFVLQIIREVAK